MKRLISCEFNIDTACVELKYSDGTMISIDCTTVENELDASMLQRGELDWLIYNNPMEYAELVLNGGNSIRKSSWLHESKGTGG